LIGAVAALLPATVHNRIAGGEWILATANGGQNFYIGNNPMNVSGEYQFLPFVDPNPKYEARDFRREAERRTGRELSPSQVSSFWFGQAWDWIRADPGGWLRLLRKKTGVFWGAYEVPDNLDYALYREDAPVLRLPLPGFGLLAPFGLLGAVFAVRRPGWPRLLVGLVAIYFVSVVMFFVLSRFRMAMTPALFGLAGLAAAESARRVRSVFSTPRAVAPVVRAVVVFLALFAVVHLPVRGRSDAPTVRLARWLGLPVRIETSATARFNLGVTYAARARDADDPAPLLQLAEEQLRKSVREDGRFAGPWVELGKVLARQHRDREAIDAYRAAERIEPRDYRIQHALGILYERIGELSEAAAAYRRALTLEPRFTASSKNLQRLLDRISGKESDEAESGGTPPPSSKGDAPRPDQ
jgi:cytochrome c-type biogenesis protein CcmH/NrfG